MNYFKSFPTVTYTFGSSGGVLGKQSFQNLSAYADVIDQYIDNVAVYQYYNILDGERADTLSENLYNTPAYHWTIWLVNSNIRESGWPLTRTELDAKMIEEYSNSVITTRTDVYGSPIEGSNNTGPLLQNGATLTGSISSASAVVDRVDPNTAQVYLTSDATFTAGEAATWTDSNGVLQTLLVESCVVEYNSVDHYEDGDGEHVDVDPTVGPGGLITEVTVKEAHERRNEELREIRVIPPQYIEQIVEAYQSTMAG